MVDISGLTVFTNKIDNYKVSENSSKVDTKSIKKDSFKDYLKDNLSSNNVKDKSITKESNDTNKKTLSTEENKLASVVDKTLKESDSLSTDELASKIVEKIENLATDSSKDVEIDSTEATKIMVLLLALINKLNEGNSNEDSKVKEESLVNPVALLESEDPVNLLNKTSENVLSNDFIALLGDDEEGTNFKDNLLEIKDILQNLIKAEEKISLSSINSELLNDNSLEVIKKDLVNEVKNLIDSMPKETKNDVIASINKVLNADESDNKVKAIFNSLLSKTVEKEDSLDNSAKVDTKVNNMENIKDINIVEKPSEDNSSDLNKESFTSKENKSNNNEVSKKENKSNHDEVSKKEEKVLMKFLEDDSSITSTKNFNYYNKLNGLPTTTDEIKMPVRVNKQTLEMDIIKNVKFMMRDAISELKVKVYPKELGEMTIKILSEEGIMKAEIKATSKETYNLLNSNLNEIKKLLENQNIKIQEVNIGIYNEDTTFFSGEDTNQNNDFNSNETQKVSGIASVDEEETIEELILENNLNILA